MANEDKKDFNAMLHRATDMPRIQLVTDAATVQKTAEHGCTLPRRRIMTR